MHDGDKTVAVRAAGREWRLFRPSDLESLWEKMGAEDPGDDERLPYWTELWPSSLGLAAWLERRQADIAGRLCLDLGCGLGLTALAGQWLGARMLAVDYEWPAVCHAQRNSLENGVSGVVWLHMDWRKPAVRPASFSRIWGADIMYEARFASPIADFLLYALAPGGLAWVAEPGRSVYQGLVEAALRRGLACRRAYSLRVSEILANPVPVDVAVWEMQKPGG